MINLRLLAAVLLLLGVSPAMATGQAPDKANAASIDTFAISSHGAGLNALVYVAAGARPHPVAILLHGFPGNEKNLDLAQAIRRAGWDVLYFDYRGSWGTPGAFSFTHCMEDAAAAVTYMRDPANAQRLRADPKQIVLIGHSMGGMVAAYTAAHDPGIRALILISSANLAERARTPSFTPDFIKRKVIAGVAQGLASEGMAPLAGCTPESLASELVEHAQEWLILSDVARLATRPVLVISSDDGGAGIAHDFYASLQKSGNRQTSEVHLATDHVYSDKRIELEKTVLAELASLKLP